MTEITYRIVGSVRADLGEGAIWVGRDARLYWLDITTGTLHAHEPATGANQAWEVGRFASAVVPRRRGGLALAVQEGFIGYQPDSGLIEEIARPEGHDPAKVRFNDGKCDPAGRFWAGSMAPDGATGVGILYRLDPDRRVRPMLRGLFISNGIAWTERECYYIDSATRCVQAFEYDSATGYLGGSRVAVRLEDGPDLPDGCTLDAEGMLWVAHWGGWKVCRWDPKSGRCLREIRLPASQISSCAFGGPDLSTLFVTSAREGMSPEQLKAEPEAGALFALRPGVAGVPAFAYAG